MEPGSRDKRRFPDHLGKTKCAASAQGDRRFRVAEYCSTSNPRPGTKISKAGIWIRAVRRATQSSFNGAEKASERCSKVIHNFRLSMGRKVNHIHNSEDSNSEITSKRRKGF